MVCALALLAVPAAAQQGGIRWQQDIEAAKATAKQTGRLVLVHFWTPECAPCLALEHRVFNQPSVAGAVESQFVPVKLNANENSATATGFGITRVPTDVILTPDGQVVGKLISPPTPAAYIAETSQMAAQFATQVGQTFAKAAAAAPAPSQLNGPYANLQVAPNSAPAATVQQDQSMPSQDRYAMAPTASAGALGGAALSTSGGTQGVQNGSYAPWTTPVQNPIVATPAPGAGLPGAPPSALASPAAVNNPYAPATSGAVPQQSPQTPAVAANPYSTVTQPGPSIPATSNIAQVSTQSLIQNSSPAVDATPAPAPDPRALPPNAPPLGFDGYCPVSMRQHWKWVAGDARFGAIHMGRTYWFAGANEQQQFLADPNRFSPVLSGMDPVVAIDHRQQVPGKREHSIDYDNLFYMFSSEATLQQFAANPERYATSVRQAMGIARNRLTR
jgi:YHS domain-containing protein/thiol-disulfide isomerase/thioredoxin